MPEEQTNSSQTSENKGKSAEITPELVKEVTEKVYAMMLKDMKISRERFRIGVNTFQRRGGNK